MRYKGAPALRALFYTLSARQTSRYQTFRTFRRQQFQQHHVKPNPAFSLLLSQEFGTMPFRPEPIYTPSLAPQITGLDHLVLTVKDLNETVMFYSRVLGFSVATFGDGRLALTFGPHKINVHPAGREYSPHAQVPTPGSADLCFTTSTSIPEWTKHLATHNVPIEEGPVERTGARGPILSIYVRDPDSNLIEIGHYQ